MTSPQEKEIDALRTENATLQEKLRTALVTGTNGMCSELKAEFVKLCQSHRAALQMRTPDNVDDFTDQLGILCISNVAKALVKTNTPGATAHRSSTAGSRVGTSHDDVLGMTEHIQQLQDELRQALKAGDDIKLLKAKLENLVERARRDKERYLLAKSGEEFAKKKMDMLRDHLEKLMTHLKHEATAKVRCQEQLRVQERELFKVQEQKAVIQRKSNAKDRLVLELREGSKILEDQLRLMDEKYLELRVKLDWARENGEKKVRKAQAAAKDLRMKFTMLTGGSTSLDKMTLPSLAQMGSQSMFDPSMAEGSISQVQLGGQESMAFQVGSATPGSRKAGKKKGASQMSMGKGSMAEGSIASSGPPTMDKVMEKIRKHAGGKTEWTEEQMRELTKSR
eukprot:GSChrysophyteH1.ASY1.ANO1.464.1 assembled CDS